MQPLTELFRSTIETFPSILLEHRVKLADITSEKEVLGLTDEEILEKDYVFPRKYELETLRYWRKMGLLPFFDQSKHAYISISQMMWLRFLSELKNLGASIAMLKEANYYFIERGYRDEVARLNLLELKKTIIGELEKDPNNATNIQTLKNVEHILNDRLLKYSIQIDFNYFNLNIIDHVINGTDVQFTVTAERILNKENNEIEKKQAFSVIRYNEDKKKTDTVLDSDKNNIGPQAIGVIKKNINSYDIYITTNIPDEYEYNNKTKVLVIDNVKKESKLIKSIPDDEISNINKFMRDDVFG